MAGSGRVLTRQRPSLAARTAAMPTDRGWSGHSGARVAFVNGRPGRGIPHDPFIVWLPDGVTGVTAS